MRNKKNYTKLERCILETANGQIFIDKTVLLGKVLKMPENTGITEADVENCLQKLTEKKCTYASYLLRIGGQKHHK